MAGYNTMFGSVGSHSPDIVPVQGSPTTDAPTGAPPAAAPPAAAPPASAPSVDKAAEKAARKKEKAEMKAHGRNDTLGYVVLGGSYAIESLMPNPDLENSTGISGHKRLWAACFGLSAAMFLLTLTVQVITWSRAVLKFVGIRLDPNYALGLLRLITLVIGVNTLIRRQLTHLNAISWVFIGFAVFFIHGGYLFIWFIVVKPIQKSLYPTTAVDVVSVAAPSTVGASVSATETRSGGPVMSNKWTVGEGGLLASPRR